MLAKISNYIATLVNTNKLYTIDNWTSYNDYNIPSWLSKFNGSTIYPGTTTFSVTSDVSTSFRPILKYKDNEATTNTQSPATFSVTNFDSSVSYQCQFYHTGTTSSQNKLTQITLTYSKGKGQSSKKIKVFEVKGI